MGILRLERSNICGKAKTILGYSMQFLRVCDTMSERYDPQLTLETFGVFFG